MVCEINAHQSPLAAMAWSADGTLLASASNKGTVIRVYNMPGANKVGARCSFGFSNVSVAVVLKEW